MSFSEIPTSAQFGAFGGGVIDETVQLQTAINASRVLHILAGTYLTTAMLQIPNNTHIFGDGKTQTIISNNVTDVIGKDNSSLLEGNYFLLEHFGVTRNFDATSTTVAFNFTNCSFIECNDIAATNFRTGVLFLRSATTFGGTSYCWYNYISDLYLTECANGIFFDDSGGSINGCKITRPIMIGWNYLWLSNSVTPTYGIYYNGYGNSFVKGYIQGFYNHIVRSQVGGDNLIDDLYLESQPSNPGAYTGTPLRPDGLDAAIYCPLGYFDNNDTLTNLHGDGVLLKAYDPFNVYKGDYTDEIELKGSKFSSGDEKIVNGSFETDALYWTLQSSTLSSVAGGLSGN